MSRLLLVPATAVEAVDMVSIPALLKGYRSDARSLSIIEADLRVN